MRTRKIRMHTCSSSFCTRTSTYIHIHVAGAYESIQTNPCTQICMRNIPTTNGNKYRLSHTHKYQPFCLNIDHPCVATTIALTFTSRSRSTLIYTESVSLFLQAITILVRERRGRALPQWRQHWRLKMKQLLGYAVRNGFSGVSLCLRGCTQSETKRSTAALPSPPLHSRMV